MKRLRPKTEKSNLYREKTTLKKTERFQYHWRNKIVHTWTKYSFKLKREGGKNQRAFGNFKIRKLSVCNVGGCWYIPGPPTEELSLLPCIACPRSLGTPHPAHCLQPFPAVRSLAGHSHSLCSLSCSEWCSFSQPDCSSPCRSPVWGDRKQGDSYERIGKARGKEPWSEALWEAGRWRPAEAYYSEGLLTASVRHHAEEYKLECLWGPSRECVEWQQEARHYSQEKGGYIKGARLQRACPTCWLSRASLSLIFWGSFPFLAVSVGVNTDLCLLCTWVLVGRRRVVRWDGESTGQPLALAAGRISAEA